MYELYGVRKTTFHNLAQWTRLQSSKQQKKKENKLSEATKN